MKHHAFDFVAPLSPLGLMLGAAAFVAALTPSMIPRPGVLQGVEAGIAFALLYGVGTGARALGSWLELPVAGDRYPRAFLRISIPLCVSLVGYGLARETDWQNAIRRAMGMPAVTAGLPVLIAIVSAPVAQFLIGLIRLRISSQPRTRVRADGPACVFCSALRLHLWGTPRSEHFLRPLWVDIEVGER
jgi:uncharacterized membrane protein